MDTQLEKDSSKEHGDDNADVLDWKDFFGSSVSLAPSLLSIFDHQVNADGNRCESSPICGMQARTKDSGIDHTNDPVRLAFCCELSSENNGIMASSQSSESESAELNSALMPPNLCGGEQSEGGYYSDFKKRPLSLRSTSSNSSFSLSLQQHQRKKIARDALPPKIGASLSPVFLDSCELPVVCETNVSRTVCPVTNGGSCDCDNITMRRSKYADTGWSNSQFLNEHSPDCLSIMENDECLYMDIDHDHACSPDIERETSGKLQLHLCQGDSASYIDRVILEIVETERAYVRDLQDIIQGYVEHVGASPGLLLQSEADTLFGNIEDVFRFHRKFLHMLEESGTDPIRIAECFVRNSSGFTIYSDYCTNYPRSVSVLTRCMRDRRLADVFKRQQMSLHHGLPLGSYLLKPVQRILKYHLLLQNLLNNFDENKAGYEMISEAFGSMMSVSDQINEMKRAHERSVRIQEIQSLLYEWNHVDPNSYGDLVLEDQFQMFGAKAFRLVWIFRKAVVIAKKKEDETIQIKALIMFSNLMLVETIQRAPLNFHLIPFDNPKVQYTVQARTMEQKRLWCQELKKLILENYEAVIPEKARQLVMMLGKEEDLCVSSDINATSQIPAKNSNNSEHRKGRHRSAGFIPDLGILKLKKGTKSGSLGTAVPDLDSSWKSENNDIFNEETVSKTVSESFNKDLDQKDQKSRTLHTSFSLQNIRSPLSSKPLQKISHSEGDWHYKAGKNSNPLFAKKLLTAESLEEEFIESDDQFSSSKSLKSRHHDCSRNGISKDSVNNSQTPPISEEPLLGDHTHQGLPVSKQSSCDGCDDVFPTELVKPSDQTLSSCQLESSLSNLKSEKFHGTVSQKKRTLPNGHVPSDCSSHHNRLLSNNLKLADFPCSSYGHKSVGNVFVDRNAFLVSESAGCMENNRMLDKCLARLCTPPRDFSNFVHDVQLSKERGKTVLHYGTPMRTVEFPEDVCGEMKTNPLSLSSGLGANMFRQETCRSKILEHRQSECQKLDDAFEILKTHPRRSTSVQENMTNSCSYDSSENSAKPKPKRSDSFHGNAIYSSTNHTHADNVPLNASNAVVAEPRASVSCLKNALLGWTGKLSIRRSRNSESHNEPVSFLNGVEPSGEKTKLRDKVSRLARASYRRLKKEKAMETVNSTDSISSDSKCTTTAEDPSITDSELCTRTRSVQLRGANVLGSYALTMLPMQKYVRKKDSVNERFEPGLHIEQIASASTGEFTNFTDEPFARRPRNWRMTEHQQIETTEEQQPHNNIVYELQYVDTDSPLGSVVSIKNKETKSAENLDSSRDAEPIKTKACSAISLPGMKNGFVWSSSSLSISSKEVCVQTSVSTDGRLNCFTAPRGYWIPYIDDSEDE